MSLHFVHPAPSAKPQAWLRYQGKVAVIEATGLVDAGTEDALLGLADSAASHGSATVVLNVGRARLAECSVPVLSRLKSHLGDVSVGFAIAGQDKAAREVLERARGEVDLVMYPSVSAPPPWSSAIGGRASRPEW